ncbi:unnamed protein product [Lathyrus oleraceus]|uniref:Nodule-specific Glycine Rich Peptide n=1 Tax=Pisum sativum TaxID=3888 RepID=A0A9D5B8N9_PEA|nr:hypothetical protein KIW84_020975 [Pisum sativum]
MKTKYFIFFLLVTILISVEAIRSSKSDATEESISKNCIDKIKGLRRKNGDGVDWVGSGTWGGWGGPREEGGEGQEGRSEGGGDDEETYEGEDDKERYEGEGGDENGDPNEDP